VMLEEWMKSYRPEELFAENGAPVAHIARFCPTGERRMGANPHANGGLLLRDLQLPDFRRYATKSFEPGRVVAESTAVLGKWLREGGALSANAHNCGICGSDETSSNGV